MGCSCAQAGPSGRSGSVLRGAGGIASLGSAAAATLAGWASRWQVCGVCGPPLGGFRRRLLSSTAHHSKPGLAAAAGWRPGMHRQLRPGVTGPHAGPGLRGQSGESASFSQKSVPPG
jgi:hypothetical protein